MTDYLIRTGKDGMVTDLMELGEDEPAECDGDKCDQLEAATVAMIKSLNERLTQAENRLEKAYLWIADLERELRSRPMPCVYPCTEPVTPPWTVTYHTTADPDLVDKYSKFTCKI